MALPDIKPIIENKKIVIFGIGGVADRFVDKYAEHMDITYFTSNDPSETEFHGFRRVEISDLISRTDIYIIICASQVGSAAIESQLSVCFQFFEQYVDCDSFEQLFAGKRKLLVIEGLCHQELLSKGLEFTPEIGDEYIIKFFWQGLLNQNAALRKTRYMLCQYADYRIILKMEGAQQNDEICREEKIIRTPLIYAQFLYPQIPCVQEMGVTYLHNPYMMNSKKNISDIRAFRYTDQNVVRLLKQGLSETDVLGEIRKEDFYDMEYLEKVKASTANINARHDAGCDIRMGEYLMENYKQKKLFLDGQHWSNIFVREAIRQIMSLLGLKESELPDTDFIMKLSGEDAVWKNEVPVYPSVSKLLELEWAKENTTYSMVKLKETKQLNFDDYMRDYIRYVNYSLMLQKVW